MELRMPVGYPGATVGGGDAIDGPGFFALSTAQQTVLFAFWTATEEFLVRVTHPAFVLWLVPAGIYVPDPTAAGRSCAAAHVLEALLLEAPANWTQSSRIRTKANLETRSSRRAR